MYMQIRQKVYGIQHDGVQSNWRGFSSNISAANMHCLGIDQFVQFVTHPQREMSVIDGGSGSGIVSLMLAVVMVSEGVPGQVRGIEYKRDLVDSAVKTLSSSLALGDILRGDSITIAHTGKSFRLKKKNVTVTLEFTSHSNVTEWCPTGSKADFIHLGFEVDDTAWNTLKTHLRPGGWLVGPHICGCPLTAHEKCAGSGGTWWCVHKNHNPSEADLCNPPVRYQPDLGSGGPKIWR